MDQISQINATQQVANTSSTQQKQVEYSTKPEQIENGDSKLKYALIGLGVVAAGGLIYAGATGRFQTLNGLTKKVKSKADDLIKGAGSIHESINKEVDEADTLLKKVKNLDINGIKPEEQIYANNKMGKLYKCEIDNKKVTILKDANDKILTIKSGGDKFYLDDSGNISTIMRGYSSKDGVKTASKLIANNGNTQVQATNVLGSKGADFAKVEPEILEKFDEAHTFAGDKLSEYVANKTSETGGDIYEFFEGKLTKFTRPDKTVTKNGEKITTLGSTIKFSNGNPTGKTKFKGIEYEFKDDSWKKLEK